MSIKPSRLLTSLIIALPMAATTVFANPILDGYKAETKGTFSVAAGEKIYHAVGPNQLSCASCHTDSPKNVGKHAKTNKAIDPLAPSVNAKRFTDAAQVEKWFKRNCNDALGRACTTQERVTS
ncbi:DUF1924 domain-containing protein [Rhodoferax sp.]|uniref:DUF1924 domain-containing protein n=1 Tax=Rhodoferax sp. TaxID=50421 RepID=UPI0026056334|nr:DUF1924 domain-containing protein [Rhodoferax sp.]MDD5480725.1 DUF1924 domain-containing protein [Rhodoferax sp.]